MRVFSLSNVVCHSFRFFRFIPSNTLLPLLLKQYLCNGNFISKVYQRHTKGMKCMKTNESFVYLPEGHSGSHRQKRQVW